MKPDQIYRMIIEFVYRETYSSRQDITFNAISNCSEVVELGQGQTRLLESKYTNVETGEQMHSSPHVVQLIFPWKRGPSRE